MNELQSKILEIFKITRDIIEKNNLKYIAIGGTAIGAVRHQGFIPWDDDIDIAMPREDYDKLLEILPSQLPENLELRTYKDSKEYILKFSKIIDKNTTIIEDLIKEYPSLDEGVFLDIMPLDGLPNSEKKIKNHIRKLSVLNKLETYTTLSANTLRTQKSKRLYKILHPLKFVLPEKYLGNKYLEEATQYSVYNSEFTAFKWDYPLSTNIMFKSDYINNLIEIPFEDTTIRMLENYDEYLKLHFGDYMQLPPIEQQFSHHGFVVIDFHNPYKEYREKYKTNKDDEFLKKI